MLLALCAPTSFGADNNYDSTVPYDKNISFVLPVKAEIYREMLDQLSCTTISLNRKAIIKSLTTRLGNEEITPPNGMTLDKVAEELYIKSVEPVLQPQVEAFNELVNKQAKENQVNVGFIGFQGLAKGMNNVAADTLSEKFHQEVNQLAVTWNKHKLL